VFPDTAEAASDTFVSVGLLNVPVSASAVIIRTKNGVFVANASADAAGGGVQFFQFLLPSSKVSGSPFVFDVTNSLQVASTAAFPFSADFSLYVSAPAKPQIILPPQFTSLLITDAPLASFVLINFGGLAGTASTSASLIMGSVSQSLVVTGYKSDGNFGTVTVQFSRNVRLAGSAQVIIFPSAAGSGSGATFSFTYVFPAPVVTPSLACTNGKSSGFIILYAVFPSSIDDQNFQVTVNSARSQIVSVDRRQCRQSMCLLCSLQH